MSLLKSIRVIEAASFITGPLAAMMLGDLGADVIKIEPPGTGDPFRNWAPDLYSPQFRACNRNKRSLTLNLKHPRGREILYRLVADADVFLENNRPGVPKHLGTDYPTIRAANERIIYCSITGFGPDGPYSGRPAYDTVAQGMAGLTGLLIDVDQPRLVGPAFADSLSGIYASYGILAALLRREQTGEGCLVETSMLGSVMAMLNEAFNGYFTTGDVPGPFSRPRVAQAYAFRTADGGAIGLHLSSPTKFWEGLTEAVGRPELREDPRFSARTARIRNYEALREELARTFAEQPRSYWLQRLSECDVPHTPINRLDEVCADPQVQAIGAIVEVEHPQVGRMRTVASPIRYDGDLASTPQAAPLLGEHTGEILGGLGYTAAEIEALRADGAV